MNETPLSIVSFLGSKIINQFFSIQIEQNQKGLGLPNEHTELNLLPIE
jgi:hypothetical protein